MLKNLRHLSFVVYSIQVYICKRIYAFDCVNKTPNVNINQTLSAFQVCIRTLLRTHQNTRIRIKAHKFMQLSSWGKFIWCWKQASRQENKLYIHVYVDVCIVYIIMSDRRHNFQFNYSEQFETWPRCIFFIYSFNKSDGNKWILSDWTANSNSFYTKKRLREKTNCVGLHEYIEKSTTPVQIKTRIKTHKIRHHLLSMEWI